MEVVVSHMQTPVVSKASPDTLPELATYLAPFASLFRRSTSRASVARALTGLLTDLPRKNCDTIAAAVAGTSTERLQHLLTDATWDPQALDQQRIQPWWRRARRRASWSWMTPGCPSKGVARSASPGNMPGRWGRWPIARWWSPPTTWRMSRLAVPPCIGP